MKYFIKTFDLMKNETFDFDLLKNTQFRSPEIRSLDHFPVSKVNYISWTKRHAVRNPYHSNKVSVGQILKSQNVES
jgi:hypothetical protein